MSDWGFRRVPSPAMQKARRLTNLRIDEVSSVDVGAGKGVEVKLMKRHEQEGAKMTLVETITKSFTLRAQGALSDFDLAVAHQQRAEELGISLAKYYASLEGKQALNQAVKATQFESLTKEALGNGHPHFNEFKKRKASVSREQHDGIDDGPYDKQRKCDGIIKDAMAKGDSYEVAATKALRAERGW